MNTEDTDPLKEENTTKKATHGKATMDAVVALSTGIDAAMALSSMSVLTNAVG